MKYFSYFVSVVANNTFFSYSLNADGLSPLDVAVLATNRPLAKMLMEFGAKEGTQCK